jgi:2-methylcitrate dehydratase PrpD
MISELCCPKTPLHQMKQGVPVSTVEDLAGFTQRLRFTDLPDAVVAKAKVLALDAFGVQLAASRFEWSKSVFRYVRSQGGPAQSTVVSYGLKTSVANAVFANSAFNHGFELDDNHAKTSLKCSALAVPTALAVGEYQVADGADFITAMVLGYELMVRSVLSIAPSLWSRGAHATGTVGALSAAAITAKLLGLDPGRTAHALAIGANQMFGFTEVPAGGRGQIKRIYASLAATGGIRAAQLAAEGLTAPNTSLEVGSGLLRAFDSTPELARNLTSELGQRWEILNVHHKIFSQDGFIQPMSEALTLLRNKHVFDVEDIERIWVGTNSRGKNELVGLIHHPTNIIDAQFSATFSVALFLIAGGAGIDEYTEKNLADPRIHALEDRVVLEIDDEVEAEFQRTRPRGAKVQIELKTGEKLYEYVPGLRELDPDELTAKFHSLAHHTVTPERANQIHHTITDLDQLPDISTLAALLVR